MPAGFSHNYPLAQDPTFPFPTPSFESNSIVGKPPIDILQSRLPIEIEIPALSCKTVRSKPFFRQTPLAEPSPRSPTPPSPATPAVLPSHPTFTQSPRTTVPLPMPPPPPPPSFSLTMPPPPPSFPQSISSPAPGPAIPTPTRYKLPSTSSRVESQDDPEDEGLSGDALTISSISLIRKLKK